MIDRPKSEVRRWVVFAGRKRSIPTAEFEMRVVINGAPQELGINDASMERSE